MSKSLREALIFLVIATFLWGKENYGIAGSIFLIILGIGWFLVNQANETKIKSIFLSRFYGKGELEEPLANSIPTK